MLTLTLPRAVYYDRILVMDAGRVIEFDTPLALFDRADSVFRALCNEAHLARADIIRIRAGSATPAPGSRVATAPGSRVPSAPGSAAPSIA